MLGGTYFGHPELGVPFVNDTSCVVESSWPGQGSGEINPELCQVRSGRGMQLPWAQRAMPHAAQQLLPRALHRPLLAICPPLPFSARAIRC